ncbi:hypothetical protein SteCoe_34333 [Stentor coeruleus]|uniref:Uncharacterized protein n=1 Tax=Stentor coeruleus TaxID=5963 RepID=A0A1R2AUT3_9CILI|nr:hypothetical protein SteCoe_34333 [Stentor coeruleus]
MRQYRIVTPTSSITNCTSKNHTENRKERTLAYGITLADVSKRKNRVVSANGSPTLQNLKSIRSRTTNNSVSPEQAAIVVKDYIMPLFRMEKEAKHLKRRSELYGMKLKQTEKKDFGIISDFKLVEELNNKLESMRETKKEIEGQLKQAHQDKIVYENDYNVLNEKLLNSESNIIFLNYNLTQTLKKVSQNKFGFSLTNEQYLKYKSLYEEEIIHSSSLSKLLEEEKAKNDKIRNMAVKLEYVNTLLVMENDILGEKLKGLYVNTLLVMENDILGEKLKGLYESLNNLIGHQSIDNKILDEYQTIIFANQKLCEDEQRELKMIMTVNDEKKELEQMVKELSDITLGIQDRKDKYIKMLREKNIKLDNELKNVSFSRDKQKAELDELDKKYKDLQDEHIKLRTKLKSYKKSVSTDLLQEKYCKNCQKPFTEAANFNWSCKRHSSQYCEKVYWCCGQKGKDAQGCITSKHISVEDKELIEDSKKNQVIVFCSSCRNQGHSLSECPKDPNARSHFDPAEELARIEDYAKNRKKMNADSYMLKRKFIGMAMQRIKKSDTIIKNEIELSRLQHKRVFSDIMRYKKEIINFQSEDIPELFNSF